MSLNRSTGHGSTTNFIQSIEKFTGKLAQKFLLSHITTTLNEVQSHSYWHQTIQFSGVCQHTMFETNQLVIV